MQTCSLNIEGTQGGNANIEKTQLNFLTTYIYEYITPIVFIVSRKFKLILCKLSLKSFNSPVDRLITPLPSRFPSATGGAQGHL